MEWMDVRRRIKDALPDRPYYLATTGARSLQAIPGDLAFRGTSRSDLVTPIPPPYLRFRVSGNYDVREFHRSGREGRDAFAAALERVGRSLDDQRAVLDFGVGCGRILRWMEPYADGTSFSGTDIDPWAVSWCRRHVHFASCTTNGAMPPLAHDDESFDLVYSHSVFTHLDRQHQSAWLTELRRVLRPGGIALLTVHGEAEFRAHLRAVQRLDPGRAAEAEAAWEPDEFFFDTESQWAGVFPDFYQNSYQSVAHTRATWGAVMPVLAHLEGGMRGNQDIVVLQAPG
jgi:SAM-dependent methyltransferase